MTINKLVLASFGSFSGRVEIDFTKLHNKVFLIDGDTGAGKTTIFDGICYALYGTPSGSRRKSETLRNQDSAAGAESFAELTFTAADGYIYTVSRTTRLFTGNKASREKSNGSADKTQVKLIGSSGIISQKLSEVNSKIVQLTGFDRDSFLRVSMLAQGEFDRFLLCSSTERRDTLRQIFKTELYLKFSSNTAEACNKANAEFNDSFKQYKNLLKQSLPEINEEDMFMEDADKYLEKLDIMRAECEASIESAECLLERLNKERLDNNTLKEKARSVNKMLEEKQEYIKNLEAIEGKKEYCLQKQAELAAKRQAQAAAHELFKHDECENRLLEAVQKQAKAEIQLKEAQKEYREAQIEFDSAQLLSAETDTLIQELTNLNSLLKDIKESEALLQQCGQLEQQIKIISDDIAHEKQLQTKCEQTAVQLSDEISRCKSLADKIPAVNAEHSRINSEIQRLEELKGDLIRLERLNASLAKACEECDEKEILLNKAAENSKILKLKYHAGTAARLALELKAGEKCPVCGSEQHPAPAKWEQEIPDSSRLEAAEQAEKNANKMLSEARNKYTGLSAELSMLKEKIADSFLKIFNSALPDDISLCGSAISEKLCALQNEKLMQIQRLNECGECERNIPALEKALKENNLLIAQSLQKREKLTEALNKAENELIRLNATAAEKQVLNRNNITAKQAETEIQSKNKRIREIKDRISNAQNALNTAMQKNSSCTAAANQLSSDVAAYSAELNNAEKELNEALSRYNFSDKEQLRLNIPGEGEIEQSEKEIAEYKNSAAVEKAKLDALNKKLPETAVYQPLEQFDEKADELDKAAKSAEQEKTKCSLRLNSINNYIGQIKETAAAGTAQQKKLKILKELDSVVNGKGKGNEKIAFETFIQMNMFRRILNSANKQLSDMSSGRYRFELREKNLRANSSAGLDINIIDYNSGAAARRDVSTLSGGERFIASFALAIGLSEYTLSQGAARRADMLFIDEGFSSLDLDTFGLACEVIEGLRSRNRMIGIVTHVPGIKDYFKDRQICVKKSRSGSTVEIVCPKE